MRITVTLGMQVREVVEGDWLDVSDWLITLGYLDAKFTWFVTPSGSYPTAKISYSDND